MYECDVCGPTDEPTRFSIEDEWELCEYHYIYG